MVYVFDTNSLRVLQNYYPAMFGSFWKGLEELVNAKSVISVREVRRELKNQVRKDWFMEWIKANSGLFVTPTPTETEFVRQMFLVPQFREMVGKKQRLQGMPVADPWVVAAGKARKATVVTEEAFKDNSAKIPNVCAYFDVPCIDLEGFASELNWKF